MLSLYSPHGGGGKRSKRVPHPLTLGLLETAACTAQVAVGAAPGAGGLCLVLWEVGEVRLRLPTPTCVFGVEGLGRAYLPQHPQPNGVFLSHLYLF